MVAWPAFIKYADDDELTFVPDNETWIEDLSFLEFEDDDFLVDASGQLYDLSKREQGHILPCSKNKAYSLDSILGLIKAHASCAGSCCVAKMYAPSVTEAFKILESLSGND